MISRYTLQFKDPEIEKKYQEYQLENKRKPLAESMIFLASIYVVERMIVSLLLLNQNDILVTLGYLLGVVSLYIIIRLKPIIIRFALMVCTFLILLAYIQIKDGEKQFTYQFYSALVVALQFIFISSGEFVDAIIQLISIFIIYTVYFITAENRLDISIILSVSMLLFLLIISFYNNAAAERSKFQLTLIDDQWDKVISSIITQPSVIFSFDSMKRAFKLKQSFDFICPCDSDELLREFLRKSKLRNNKTITLESLIFSEIKLFKKGDDKKINQKQFIEFDKQIYEINYSTFSGASPIVLIKIVKFEVFGENKQLQMDNYSQYKYLTLLKGVYLRLKREFPFKNKNLNGIFKTLIFRNLLENLDKGVIKQYYFKNVIKRLSELYQDKQISFQNNSQQSFIYGQKEIMFLTLMEIFESTLSHEINIMIQRIEDGSIIELKVESNFNEKTIEKFNLRAKYLINYFEDLVIDQRCVSLKLKNKIAQIISKPHFIFQF